MELSTDQTMFDIIEHELATLMPYAVRVTSAQLIILAAMRQRDVALYQHSLRVAALSFEISFLTFLNDHERQQLITAALLHDCGKLLIPHRLLYAESLTHAEQRIVQRHVHDAQLVINDATSAECLPIIQQHHEQPDGRGYPFGIRHMLTASRVLALANGLDHLLTQSLSQSNIRQALRREAGRRWDAILTQQILATWYVIPPTYEPLQAREYAV